MPEQGKGGDRWFETTRWSLVQAAADSGLPAHREALSQLCQGYWKPVYAYIRSRGSDVDTAQDLTQGFFMQLLDKRYLKGVRRPQGKFRSFLLICVKHYLSNEWDRAQTKKRGGGEAPLSFDVANAESFITFEPADVRTPEVAFERQWAQTVMDQVMTRLEIQMKSSSNEARFHHLKPFLTGDASGTPYRQVASELGMSEGAVKVAVHALRKKFGNLLREAVADTVTDRGMVDEEIRFLFNALGH